MYYYTIWIGFHFISFIWIAASVCDIGADTVGAAAVAAVAAVGAIGNGLAFVRIHCECDNKHVVAAAVVIMWVCVWECAPFSLVERTHKLAHTLLCYRTGNRRWFLNAISTIQLCWNHWTDQIYIYFSISYCHRCRSQYSVCVTNTILVFILQF